MADTQSKVKTPLVQRKIRVGIREKINKSYKNLNSQRYTKMDENDRANRRKIGMTNSRMKKIKKLHNTRATKFDSPFLTPEPKLRRDEWLYLRPFIRILIR